MGHRYVYHLYDLSHIDFRSLPSLYSCTINFMFTDVCLINLSPIRATMISCALSKDLLNKCIFKKDCSLGYKMLILQSYMKKCVSVWSLSSLPAGKKETGNAGFVILLFSPICSFNFRVQSLCSLLLSLLKCQLLIVPVYQTFGARVTVWIYKL